MLPIIHAIPALKDNYIWAIVHPTSQQALIVDPGDASVVIDFLTRQNLKLAAILITHHHWDHTNGIDELVNKYSVAVFGPHKDYLPSYTQALNDNEAVTLAPLGLQFHVISVPGHTQGHIAYYGHNSLFSGDTLFSAGCGRLFEGTADQLLSSLQRLAQLPPQTNIYCGHEYTLNNLCFAAEVEPHNNAIQRRIAVIQAQAPETPTLPSSMAVELETNPFLRCHIPAVQAAVEHKLGHKIDSILGTFAALRAWKDTY